MTFYNYYTFVYCLLFIVYSLFFFSFVLFINEYETLLHYYARVVANLRYAILHLINYYYYYYYNVLCTVSLFDKQSFQTDLPLSEPL